MKVKDIVSAIERFAPLSLQESWDNSGLLVGSPEDEVHGVLVGFDCTAALIDEAVERGCDMVVTHHPLIFKGIKKINADDPVGAAVMKAVRCGVAVYAAHTSADKTPGGVSAAMAARLGLTDVEVLIPEGEGCAGLGCVGNLPWPMDGEEAVAYVKEKFGLAGLRASAPLKEKFSRVAVLGGSGGGEIADALRSGASLYISADFSYHSFFTPAGFMIMDIGHFESEVEIVDILLAEIRKKFPNFASCKSACLAQANPVRYY